MKVRASSFADLADLAAFEHCKRQGRSDAECMGVGDNGLGCWNDLTAQDVVPMCALPPEDIIARWGSMTAKAARRRLVKVRANEREVVCLLADRMPSKAHITNGAGIDLNPAAAKSLNLRPPFMVEAEWEWIES